MGHALNNHLFKLILDGGQDSIDHMEEIAYSDPDVLDVMGPLIDSRANSSDDGASARQVLGSFAVLRPRLEPARIRGPIDAAGGLLGLTDDPGCPSRPLGIQRPL